MQAGSIRVRIANLTLHLDTKFTTLNLKVRMRSPIATTALFVAAGLVSAGPTYLPKQMVPPEGMCRLFCCYPVVGDYDCVANCTRLCDPDGPSRGRDCPTVDWDGNSRCPKQASEDLPCLTAAVASSTTTVVDPEPTPTQTGTPEQEKRIRKCTRLCEKKGLWNLLPNGDCAKSCRCAILDGTCAEYDEGHIPSLLSEDPSPTPE